MIIGFKDCNYYLGDGRFLCVKCGACVTLACLNLDSSDLLRDGVLAPFVVSQGDFLGVTLGV